MTSPMTLIDLAARSLGGSVVAANDESFGEKESLIVPRVAGFLPGRYGHKGELVDGWETRRRRELGDDWAIVRLAASGVVSRVDIDTTSFTGNYPSRARLEGCTVDGHPSVAELQAASWRGLVPWTPLTGDAHHLLDAAPAGRVTHVRLVIRPDGGVARLRVLGRVTPDPRRFDGLTVDLAAAELGGVIEASSDEFYSSPTVLLLPGVARTMGEGWETRRNREGGNDWLVLRLAAAGVFREIEVDTSYYVANASGEV